MVMSFEECNLQPNGHTIAVQEYSHWKLTFKVQCLPLARLSLQKHNASTKSLHLIILAALLLCCHITFRPYASSCFLHSFYMLPTVCYILFLHFHLFLPFPPCALTIMLNPVFMLSAVSHILAFCFQLFITFWSHAYSCCMCLLLIRTAVYYIPISLLQLSPKFCAAYYILILCIQLFCTFCPYASGCLLQFDIMHTAILYLLSLHFWLFITVWYNAYRNSVPSVLTLLAVYYSLI